MNFQSHLPLLWETGERQTVEDPESASAWWSGISGRQSGTAKQTDL